VPSDIILNVVQIYIAGLNCAVCPVTLF